jgi:beta-glucanase (GH16 family)
MEHVGFNPDTIFSTVHTDKFNHMIGTQIGKRTALPTATSGFHVYSMEWNKNEIKSYVDGEHYFTFTKNGEGFEAWPFDQPFHLILNLAIGGTLGGK